MRGVQASITAQFLALIRALGDLLPEAPGFSDPVAAQMLSPAWRAMVERARARLPVSPYPFWARRGMAVFNQFRTVALDRAIAEALTIEQLVILGAGFDGRAYRLAGLRDTRVFEVDHPGTQAVKIGRAAGLTPQAREIRHVGMDFTTDDLAERLPAAGLDPTRPTFWLWEGVTMYLTACDVAKTMSRAASVSAAGSRMALTYFARSVHNSFERFSVAVWAMLIGEPLRCAFDGPELHSLAFSVGWSMLSDTGIEDWKAEFGPGVALSPHEVGIQWDERIWAGCVRAESGP